MWWLKRLSLTIVSILIALTAIWSTASLGTQVAYRVLDPWAAGAMQIIVLGLALVASLAVLGLGVLSWAWWRERRLRLAIRQPASR